MRHVLICILITLAGQYSFAQNSVRVGSKLFNESVMLGEIVTQLLENEEFEVDYYSQLGGTRILWNSILEGEIDLYPDYTGTIIYEILGESESKSIEELNEELINQGIQLSNPIGFNNSYALGMRKELADSLQISTISDLKKYPDLRFGFSNEFLDRNDGWIGLKAFYNLPHDQVRGLDHDLAYRGLESGVLDVIDLYTTDAEIQYYQLTALTDNASFFPEYSAVIVYRTDLSDQGKEVIRKLEGLISEEEMITLNAAVKLEGKGEVGVAADFLEERFQIEGSKGAVSITDRLITNTIDHLKLVLVSLSLAIFIALPLGVMASKNVVLAQPILSITGILQTIPSLALLVFMIPLFGIGTLPAMAALFLYSLLPIVRNTHSGLNDIDQSLKDSAMALGLPKSLILRKIELPIAAPTILAGIKTSAVINVGTATLGALIGAGGYGQPILTGIRLDDTSLILQGAIPAALLALIVQWGFDLLEKRWSYK